MVHRSLDAFVRRDCQLARGVLIAHDTVDGRRDSDVRHHAEVRQWREH